MAPSSSESSVTRAALVTGSRRIGAAVARALGDAEFDVAVACHRSRAEADGAARAIRETGRRAVVIEADLSDAQQCRDLVDRAATAFGRLDVAALLASRFDRQPLAELDAPAWDRALAVDLSASFHCAHAAVPHLRRAGGGHIVLFSDWVAASGRPRYRGFTAYYVAKRGVIALGEALALELARDAIQVHVVAPGPIVPVEGATESEQAGVIRATPLGRYGGAGEVARLVLQAVRSSFVTGETVRVDGGRHLP
jgi:NAD(P)-dependent dehydrogenase (short-subunit alcohol dehydrogenase family)